MKYIYFFCTLLAFGCQVSKEIPATERDFLASIDQNFSLGSGYAIYEMFLVVEEHNTENLSYLVTKTKKPSLNELQTVFLLLREPEITFLFSKKMNNSFLVANAGEHFPSMVVAVWWYETTGEWILTLHPYENKKKQETLWYTVTTKNPLQE